MQTLIWQKSSFSGNVGENCVELAFLDENVALRESDDPLAVVRATPSRLAALVAAAKREALGGLRG